MERSIVILVVSTSLLTGSAAAQSTASLRPTANTNASAQREQASNLLTPRRSQRLYQEAPEDQPSPGFLHITLAAGAGAVAGGTAAGLLLLNSAARGDAAGDAFVIAAFVGGGTLGAASATSRWGDSFFGSLVGTAGALLFAVGVDRAAESAGYELHGFGLVVGYGLIHGALTALVVRR